MKKKVINSIVSLVVDAERVICPEYCGLLDRCRVVALLFLTLCEACIIPYHIVLFLTLGGGQGLVLTAAHAALIGALEYLVWTRKVSLDQGLAGLFSLVVIKLTIDCVLSYFFGHPDDHISVMNNLFIMFVLSYTCITLRLHKVNIFINLVIVSLYAIFAITLPAFYLLFSAKAMFVALVMNVFVSVTTMDFIQVGLRRKLSIMSKEEEKALALLAEMKEKASAPQASTLLGRFSPEIRQDMMHLVATQLQHEKMQDVTWEKISPDLTKSEIEICKLIVQGYTLRKICEKTGKSESNITSQRTHIRKKLGMSKDENLKVKLTKLVMQNVGGGIEIWKY